jgi:hypothetical protein
VNYLLVDVDPRRLAEQDRDVRSVDDASYRRGDVARVQDRRRHLIEEGLKDVVVAAIDESDVDALAAQPDCRLEASEAPTENDNMWTPFVTWLHRMDF